MEGNSLVQLGSVLGPFIDNLIVSELYNIIEKVLPIALPVMGAIVLISIGVKVFKRFVK